MIGLLFLLVPWALKADAVPISVSADTLAFGGVVVGTTAERELVLSHPGDLPTPVSIDVKGEGFAAFPTSVTIAPGEHVSIHATFEPREKGPGQGTLTVQTAMPEIRVGTVVLVGIGRAGALSVSPQEIDFGEVRVGTSRARSFVLSNSGDARLEILTAKVAGGRFTVSDMPDSALSPGGEVSIVLTFSPGTRGAVLDTLSIFSTDPDRRQVHIPLKGRGIAPELAISPLPEVGISFSETEVGGTVRRTLIVLNQGDAPLHISEISASGAGDAFSLSHRSFDVPPRGQQAVKVSFAPGAQGEIRGTLRVRSDDPEAEEMSMPLRGQGVVLPPEMVLGAHEVDFGRVPLDRSARETVLIWNRGGGILHVKVEERGDEEGLFDAAPTSFAVEPGGIAKVRTVFVPRRPGACTAVLLLTGDGHHTELPLIGEGRCVRLHETALEFGRVPVYGSKTLSWGVANAGNADFVVREIRVQNADFRILPEVGDPSGYKLIADEANALEMQVVFTPSARGLVSGTVEIKGQWDEETDVLRLFLMGTGIAPEMDVYPSGTIGFGDVIMGERVRRELIITNSGDATLRVDAHAKGEAFFVDPALFVLAPDSSRRIALTFAPTDLGPVRESLTLISNDAKDRAQTIPVTGRGILGEVDLPSIAAILTSRAGRVDTLEAGWNSIPRIVPDGTRLNVAFHFDEALQNALTGRSITVEWMALDEEYYPVGRTSTHSVLIDRSSGEWISAPGLNLRMREKKNRRVKLAVWTKSHPEALPQRAEQILEVGGWKWEFEAKPLVSLVSIRPGRGGGRSERLIGLPGIAFAGWHNRESRGVSGIHFTAIGDLLQALGQDVSLAISLGTAISFYKDKLLIGIAGDVYDRRQNKDQTQDYVITIKYAGFLESSGG